MSKADMALFYTCSLIEFMGRQTLRRRHEVVDALGEDVERIYHYQDVFHCEPIAKVADDFIVRAGLRNGDFDNVSACRYTVPGYWEIGAVFERLIEDCFPAGQALTGLREVHHSWMADQLMNFNTDLYYQPRDYLAECYRAGSILIA